jgi:hypothetical protein
MRTGHSGGEDGLCHRALLPAFALHAAFSTASAVAPRVSRSLTKL